MRLCYISTLTFYCENVQLTLNTCHHPRGGPDFTASALWEVNQMSRRRWPLPAPMCLVFRDARTVVLHTTDDEHVSLFQGKPSFQCISTVGGQPDGVTELAFAGKYLVATGADGSIVIWEVVDPRGVSGTDFPVATSPELAAQAA